MGVFCAACNAVLRVICAALTCTRAPAALLRVRHAQPQPLTRGFTTEFAFRLFLDSPEQARALHYTARFLQRSKAPLLRLRAACGPLPRG